MPLGSYRGDNWGSQRNLHNGAPTTSLSKNDISEVSEECEDYGTNCPSWYRYNSGGVENHTKIPTTR